ncbi:hypothetical protein [Brevibacillus marinus]|uniref:hypothetical protein n=1 Tax=Brevibacillus marinus TaxID=2496837 RepID=UPI000F8489E8|nr:hypothetical protein [Brevibacillus marinus]
MFLAVSRAAAQAAPGTDTYNGCKRLRKEAIALKKQNELSSEDLALLAAALVLIGDFLTFWSLLKEKQNKNK